MRKRLRNRLLLTAASLTLMGCAGAKPSNEVTPAPGEIPTNGELYQPANRPGWADSSLTNQECQQRGGTIVGDIGDGAIHRPDYRCDSGVAPIGIVTFYTGQPAPIEGAVCCR